MTTEAWTYVLVTVTFMLYLAIGWWARVRESSGFFVAGRGVPAVANGMATASDWMSAASFMGMAGLISFMGSDGMVYLLGWTGGYVLLALLLAPYLRKFGKYTVPDFIGDRYYSGTARVVAVIAAIFISVTYVAGQMRGVGIVFSRFLGIGVEWGVVIGMVIVTFFAVLGGMKGITWTQVAQYVILITAYMIPVFALSMMLTGLPLPQLALPFGDVVPKLNGIYEELGLAAYTGPFATTSKIDVLFILVALMVGTAGLPHVIVRFYTTPDVRSARKSAMWALIFIAVLYTSAPALAAFARYNLMESVRSSSVEEIKEMEWVQKWQATNLVAVNPETPPARLRLLYRDETKNVWIDPDMVVLSTPEVAGLSSWVIALVAAGALAAALSTASGLLLVLSSSLAHDIYFRMINPNATEARRVGIGRIMVIVGVAVAGYFGINPPGFVAQVVAFAFGLAAASFFPVILLGIFDKRTNREGAIAGMLCGLGFTLFYIVGTRYGMSRWFFGVSPEGIGTAGMLINFAVTLVVSRLTPAPPQDIQDMVDSIRLPEHPGRAAILDESTE